MTFDIRVRSFAGSVRNNGKIAVIYLDQPSLEWAEEELDLTWPWPRETYSLIVDFLSQAKRTAFDVLFVESSAYGVDDDRSFADSIRRAGNVVLSVVPRRGSGIGLAPELAATGVPTGSVALAPDTDGVFRLYPPLVAVAAAVAGETAVAGAENALFPSLGLAVYRGTGEPDAESLGNRKLVPRFGRAAEAFSRYNAAEILASALALRAGSKPAIDPDAFRDLYVFFGFSAPGLHDRQATPVSVASPGVDVHAFFLKSILDTSFIVRISPWIDHLFAVFCGLAAASSLSLVRSGKARILVSLAGLCLAPAAGFAAYTVGLWIGVAESGLAAILSLASVFTAEFARTGRQRTFLKNAFGQYLSPLVIEAILDRPGMLALGGERRVVSVMFTDLEGFTAIAEALDPERLALVLNEYLSAMSDIIFEEGGTIDKYEGDGIIAFWNAPLRQEDHALRAYRAAVRCLQRLGETGERLANIAGIPASRQENSPESRFRMRIGIHTGPAAVGNMGSRQRFNYTVLGDTVNLASRLEGANKTFGTSILVSGAVVEAAHLPSETMRHIARIAVVGRCGEVDVYEPCGERGVGFTREFSEARDLFLKGDFLEAATRFGILSSDDPVSAAYSVKCASLAAQPPDPWDGLWVLESK